MTTALIATPTRHNPPVTIHPSQSTRRNPPVAIHPSQSTRRNPPVIIPMSGNDRSEQDMPEDWRIAPDLQWQVLPTLVASGEIQMAIDQWLLAQASQTSLGCAWLRFYRCAPPAITLGCFQRTIPAHWRSLSWQGQAISLVRRPTGGRAVLHSGDLCYSLVMPRPRTGRRLALYCELCQFLIAGWRSLGVPLQFGGQRDGAPRYQDRANCFATGTGADLVDVRGHKVIGSALRVERTHLLQQGAMVLAPEPGLLEAVFGPEAIAPMPLTQWQRSPVGQPPQLTAAHVEAITAALTQAAIARWGGTWGERVLTTADWEPIRAIAPTLQVRD